jgi:hypothetical protein
MNAIDKWVQSDLDLGFIKKWQFMCQTALILFLLMQLNGGVVRWVLDMVGAAPLTYIPNLLMVGCTFSILIYKLYFQKLTLGVFLFIALIILSLFVGIVTTNSVVQPVFGLWVLAPFMFGLTCAPAFMVKPPHRMLLLYSMFFIAVGGVIVHSFVPYPWVGVSYQVGGVELEGAREWETSGGSQRLSGLARSSFDVAGQIVVAAGLLSLRIPKGFFRFMLWVFCTVAVSLSTSKGILLALLMTVIASEALIRDNARLLKFTFVIGIFWLFVPPIMGWTMDWQEAARTDIDNPLYGSFIDRMNDMWPRALELATEHGLPLLGRGLGGIGVPVSIFEPVLANAGDNVFVYCYVLVGVFSIPIFMLGIATLLKLSGTTAREDMQDMLLLAVIINWYGGVSNILEHAVLALAMGVVCRYISASLAGNPFEKIIDSKTN